MISFLLVTHKFATRKLANSPLSLESLLMKMLLIFALLAAVFTTVLAFSFIFGDGHVYHGLAFDPPAPAYDFVLRDVETGQPFHFEQERGEVTLLYFGYIQCPDVCPMTLGVWRQVKKSLGLVAKQVRFIFITVDPERDTPEIVAGYMNAFDETFIGLRGEPERLAEVVDAYNIFVEKAYFDNTASGYTVNHTASTLLIDPQGNLRVQYPFGTEAEAIVEDIVYLLE